MQPVAAKGFQRSAAAYDRGRPGYAPAGVAWMAERLGLAEGATVVDLAAGTGKLTADLVATGALVVAVEPVAAMRAVLAQRVPGARAVDGTAEATGLADTSADAVTVGQAFHWFDGDAAVAEIHRILRPGGRLGVIYNTRDLQDPLQAALSRLVQPYRGSAPAHAKGQWREALQRTALLQAGVERLGGSGVNQVAGPGVGGAIGEYRVDQVQLVDAEGLVDRVLSMSFIAALPTGEQASIAQAARLAAAHTPATQVDPKARLRLHYLTEVAVWTRR